MKWLLTLIFLAQQVWANDFICYPNEEWCPDYGHRSSTSPSYPSKSSRININPSAVPIEKGTGFEVIEYRGYFDFSVVKGTGRVGASLSPSNSEETFFGPPGFESDTDFLNRQINGYKYQSQKINLATAFSLVNNKKKGLKKFELNLGVIGKYNKVNKNTYPGGGLSGVLGPLTFGYAYSNDNFAIETLGITYNFNYSTETKSVGVRIGSLVLDYSQLRLIFPQEYSSTNFIINILTASLLFKKVLLTYSVRSEDSTRLRYNPDTKLLETKQIKSDAFAGLQFTVRKNLLLGVFYNYYLLREASFGATLFF